jgi:hypothetical protein
MKVQMIKAMAMENCITTNTDLVVCIPRLEVNLLFNTATGWNEDRNSAG